MVVCRGPRAARRKALGCVPRAAAHRARSRAFHRSHHRGGHGGTGHVAALRFETHGGCGALWIWDVPAVPLAAPKLGRHARWISGPDPLVVHHGLGARGGTDVDSVISQLHAAATWPVY